MHKKHILILTSVFDVVIGACDDPWSRRVGELVAELGVDLFYGPKLRLKKRLTKVAVAGVPEQNISSCLLTACPPQKSGFNLSHMYATARQEDF